MVINFPLLSATAKIFDSSEGCHNEHNGKSVLKVRTLSANKATNDKSSVIYSLEKIQNTEEFIIDYTTAYELVEKESVAPAEYDVVFENEFSASPTPETEGSLQSMLEYLVEKVKITRILLSDDYDISLSLLAIARLVPVSSSCISIEFQSQKRGVSSKCQEANLESIFIALCGSPALLKTCKSFSVANIGNVSRRRCAEIAKTYLPNLSNLEILSITHEHEAHEMQSEASDFDLRVAGGIWADVIHAHPNLRVLRGTKGPEYWMPVYFLGGSTSQGWMSSLTVDWSPLPYSDGGIRIMPEPLSDSSTRKKLTELEISLTAALMVLNTWVVEISLRNLLLPERQSIVQALQNILGEDSGAENMFDWTSVDDLAVISRPQGKPDGEFQSHLGLESLELARIYNVSSITPEEGGWDEIYRDSESEDEVEEQTSTIERNRLHRSDLQFRKVPLASALYVYAARRFYRVQAHKKLLTRAHVLKIIYQTEAVDNVRMYLSYIAGTCPPSFVPDERVVDVLKIALEHLLRIEHLCCMLIKVGGNGVAKDVEVPVPTAYPDSRLSLLLGSRRTQHYVDVMKALQTIGNSGVIKVSETTAALATSGCRQFFTSSSGGTVDGVIVRDIVKQFLFNRNNDLPLMRTLRIGGEILTTVSSFLALLAECQADSHTLHRDKSYYTDSSLALHFNLPCSYVGADDDVVDARKLNNRSDAKIPVYDIRHSNLSREKSKNLTEHYEDSLAILLVTTRATNRRARKQNKARIYQHTGASYTWSQQDLHWVYRIPYGQSIRGSPAPKSKFTLSKSGSLSRSMELSVDDSNDIIVEAAMCPFEAELRRYDDEMVPFIQPVWKPNDVIAEPTPQMDPEFTRHLLSLRVRDTDSWRKIALLALRDSTTGSGWRFLKAHSMVSFYSDRVPDKCTGGSERHADKLQPRINALQDGMAHVQNQAVKDRQLVATPRVPVAAGAYRLNLIRPGGPRQRRTPRDTIEQKRNAEAMRTHLGLREYLTEASDWYMLDESQGFDDELVQWEFAKHLLSLSLDDAAAWRIMAERALKETSVGNGWRFLKAYSMVMFHSDRRPDDFIGAASRHADKLQGRIEALEMGMTCLQNEAVRDRVLVATPLVPLAAGAYRLNLIRPGGPRQRRSFRDSFLQKRSAEAMMTHLGLREYMAEESDWLSLDTTEGSDDELSQWEFGKRLFDLPINDSLGWRGMGLEALKWSTTGSGWRFLKAYSMVMFHSDRAHDDLVSGAKRYADKLQPRLMALERGMLFAQKKALEKREFVKTLHLPVLDGMIRLNMLRAGRLDWETAADSQLIYFPQLEDDQAIRVWCLRQSPQFNIWYDALDKKNKMAVQSAIAALRDYPEGRVLSLVTSTARESFAPRYVLSPIAMSLRGCVSLVQQAVVDILAFEVAAASEDRTLRENIKLATAEVNLNFIRQKLNIRLKMPLSAPRVRIALPDLEPELEPEIEVVPPEAVRAIEAPVRRKKNVQDKIKQVAASAMTMLKGTRTRGQSSASARDVLELGSARTDRSNSMATVDSEISMTSASEMRWTLIKEERSHAKIEELPEALVDDIPPPTLPVFAPADAVSTPSPTSRLDAEYSRLETGTSPSGKLKAQTLYFHCGGVGMQIGSSLWDLARTEEGSRCDDRMLLESSSGKKYPPALFFDIDSTALDFDRTVSGNNRDKVLKPWQCAWSHHDSTDPILWSMTDSKSDDSNVLKKTFETPTRRMLESIDNVDSIVLTHASFGRAGSFFSGSISDFIHDNFGVKKWCRPMLHVSAVCNPTEGVVDLTPLQSYLQSSNLASQHFNRHSDCTALVNCDWNPREEYDSKYWESAFSLYNLLQPPNERAFYPEITETGFSKDLKKVYTEAWSLSSVLQNYVDPRPLALHFAEIKQYSSSSQAIADYSLSGVLSCHSVIAGNQHYKNYNNLLFRTSHLTLGAWINTSSYDTPLDNLSSWAFFSNRSNHMTEASNTAQEIVSLMHSRRTVHSLLRPAASCASHLWSKRVPAFSHYFREDEFAEAKSVVSWFDDELECFDSVISATFSDSDDIMTTLNDDEKSLILTSLNKRKIAVCVGEKIIKKMEEREFAGTTVEIPLDRIDPRGIEAVLNQLTLTDRRSANLYVNLKKGRAPSVFMDIGDIYKEDVHSSSKCFHVIPVDRFYRGLDSLFEHSIFEATSPLCKGTAAVLRIPESCSVRYSADDNEARAVSLVLPFNMVDKVIRNMPDYSDIKVAFLESLNSTRRSPVAVEIVCQLVVGYSASTVDSSLRWFPPTPDTALPYAIPVIKDLTGLSVFGTHMPLSITGYITSPSRSTLHNYIVQLKGLSDINDFSNFAGKLVDSCLEVGRRGASILYWNKSSVMLDYKNRARDSRGQLSMESSFYHRDSVRFGELDAFFDRFPNCEECKEEMDDDVTVDESIEDPFITEDQFRQLYEIQLEQQRELLKRVRELEESQSKVPLPRSSSPDDSKRSTNLHDEKKNSFLNKLMFWRNQESFSPSSSAKNPKGAAPSNAAKMNKPPLSEKSVPKVTPRLPPHKQASSSTQTVQSKLAPQLKNAPSKPSLHTKATPSPRTVPSKLSPIPPVGAKVPPPPSPLPLPAVIPIGPPPISTAPPPPRKRTSLKLPPGSRRTSARRHSVWSQDFDPTIDQSKRFFRFHDMSCFRRDRYHLEAEDFISMSAAAADSLVPPEHIEPLLRCVKGFSPMPVGCKPAVTDSQTTVWHLGVKLLQAYVGNAVFSNLPVFRKQMDAIAYDERGAVVIAAVLTEKVVEKESFRVFLMALRMYQCSARAEGRDSSLIDEDFVTPSEGMYPKDCRNIPLGQIVLDVRSGKLYNSPYHADELKKAGFEWCFDRVDVPPKAPPVRRESELQGPVKATPLRRVSESDDTYGGSVTYELACKYSELVDKFCVDLVDEEKTVLSKYHMVSGLPQLFARMLCRVPEQRMELWEVKKRLSELVSSVGETAVLRRVDQLSDLFNKRMADMEGRVESQLEAQDLAINDLKDELYMQANLLDGLYDRTNQYPRLILMVPDTSNIMEYAMEIGVNKISNGMSNFMESLLSLGMTSSVAAMVPQFYSNFNWKRFLMQEYRICCICEFTGVLLDSGLKVGMVKKWFKMAAPFIQLGLTVGKIVGATCGVPIGGTIDVIKGAIRSVIGTEIKDSAAATNLALLTTSNCQFWAPLLDQAKELLALTEALNETTRKSGDVLLDMSIRLKAASEFYRVSIKQPTSIPLYQAGDESYLSHPARVAASVKQLICLDSIEGAANELEHAQKLLLERELTATKASAVSSPASASLVEAVKQLYYMGEDSREGRGLFGSRRHFSDIVQNLFSAFRELLDLPPNRVAARRSSSCREGVHRAIHDTVAAVERFDRGVLAMRSSTSLSVPMTSSIRGLSFKQAEMKELRSLEIGRHRDFDMASRPVGESERNHNIKSGKAEHHEMGVSPDIAAATAISQAGLARDAASRAVNALTEAEGLMCLCVGARVMLRDLGLKKEYPGVVTAVNRNEDKWGDVCPSYSVSLDGWKEETEVPHSRVRLASGKNINSSDRAAHLIIKASADADIALSCSREAAVAALHLHVSPLTRGIKLKAQLETALDLFKKAEQDWEQYHAYPDDAKKSQDIVILLQVTEHTAECAMISAVERATRLAAYLASELSTYAECGDPSYKRKSECLSAVLKALPGLNSGGQFKFSDSDLEGVLDALQEIKQALAEEDPDPSLESLTAYVGTALMKIPSCAAVGKQLRDTYWAGRPKSAKLNAQDWCDEAVNLYNDGIVDSDSKQYESAEKKLENALRKLEEVDSIASSSDASASTASLSTQLAYSLRTLIPIEVGSLVDVDGKQRNASEDLYEGVVISDYGFGMAFDCAVKPRINLEDPYADLLSADVVVDCTGSGDWRRGRSAKSRAPDKSFQVKMALDGEVQSWEPERVYLFLPHVPIEDITVDRQETSFGNKNSPGTAVECNCYDLGMWYPGTVLKRREMAGTVDVLLTCGMVFIDVSACLVRSLKRAARVGCRIQVARKQPVTEAGVVTQICGDGKYDVSFHSGLTTIEVKEKFVRLNQIIQMGDPVDVFRVNAWTSGTVAAVSSSFIDVCLDSLKGGEKVRVNRSSVRKRFPSLQPGTEVYARRLEWVAGEIVNNRQNGTFDVSFGVGSSIVCVNESRISFDRCKTGAADEEVEEAFAVGARVEAKAGKWRQGKIKTDRRDGTYDVEYPKGVVEYRVGGALIRSRYKGLFGTVNQSYDSMYSTANLKSDKDKNDLMQYREKFGLGEEVDVNYPCMGEWSMGRIIRFTEKKYCDVAFDNDYLDVQKVSVKFVHLEGDYSWCEAGAKVDVIFMSKTWFSGRILVEKEDSKASEAELNAEAVTKASSVNIMNTNNRRGSYGQNNEKASIIIPKRRKSSVAFVKPVLAPQVSFKVEASNTGSAFDRASSTQYEVQFDDGETHVVSKKHINAGDCWAGLAVEFFDFQQSVWAPGTVSAAESSSLYHLCGDGEGRDIFKIDYIDETKMDIRRVDEVQMRLKQIAPTRITSSHTGIGASLECNANKSGKWLRGRVVQYHPDGLMDVQYDPGALLDGVSADHIIMDETKLQQGSQVKFQREGTVRRGVISCDTGGETYDIMYEEDSKCESKVPVKDIIPSETGSYPVLTPRIEINAKVLCNWHGLGQFYPAIVTSVSENESNTTYSVAFNGDADIVEEGVHMKMLRQPLPTLQAKETKISTLKALAAVCHEQGGSARSARHLCRLLALYTTDSTSEWSGLLSETFVSLKIALSDKLASDQRVGDMFTARVAAIQDALQADAVTGPTTTLVILADIFKDAEFYEGLPHLFERFKGLIRDAKTHHWIKLAYSLSDLALIVSEGFSASVERHGELGTLSATYAKDALVFALKQQTLWMGVPSPSAAGTVVFDGVASTIAAMNSLWSIVDCDTSEIGGICNDLKLDIGIISASKKRGYRVLAYLKNLRGKAGDVIDQKASIIIPKKIAMPKILKFFSSRFPAINASKSVKVIYDPSVQVEKGPLKRGSTLVPSKRDSMALGLGLGAGVGAGLGMAMGGNNKSGNGRRESMAVNAGIGGSGKSGNGRRESMAVNAGIGGNNKSGNGRRESMAVNAGIGGNNKSRSGRRESMAVNAGIGGSGKSSSSDRRGSTMQVRRGSERRDPESSNVVATLARLEKDPADRDRDRGEKMRAESRRDETSRGTISSHPEELTAKLHALIDELGVFKKSNRMELSLTEIRALSDGAELDSGKQKKQRRENIQSRIDRLVSEHKTELAEFSSSFFEAPSMANWKEKIGVKFVRSGNKVAWIDKRAENDWMKFTKDQERKLTAQRRGGQLRS